MLDFIYHMTLNFPKNSIFGFEGMHHFNSKFTEGYEHIFCPDTHPQSLGWSQKINKKNLKVPCQVAYQVNGKWSVELADM